MAFPGATERSARATIQACSTLPGTSLPPSGSERSLALHPAAAAPMLGWLRALLAYGWSPTRPDAKGNTPLHFCAAFGHRPAAEILLLAGADPRAVNLQGMNPKLYAREANATPARHTLHTLDLLASWTEKLELAETVNGPCPPDLARGSL